MTKEEFLLRGVKDGSITVEKALELLKEGQQTNVNKTTNKFEKLVNETINELESEQWDNIVDYLRDRKWTCVNSHGELDNINNNPNLAKENAFDVGMMVLKGLQKEYDRYLNGELTEDDLQYTGATGVFTGTAYIENGNVELEIQFTPESMFTSESVKELF